MLQMMKAHRDKRERGDDGFTLIELLVVVVIIGILIAIAIPLYLNYRRGANDRAAQSDLRNAISVLEVCNSDNGGYPTGATTSGSTVTFTGCSGQTANLSNNTSMSYSGTAASYKAVSTNSGGTKYFCYSSATGGSVREVTATSLATALTACT